jgi:hypothetical protein
MNDAHLNRQHRLQYTVRGPEWAFAIPAGDFDALEDVMRRCSTFWNGAGSLIIPVTKNGRIERVFGDMLDTRSVEACFTHESLSARALDAVAKLGVRAVPFYDQFDIEEMHPLLFAADLSEDAPKPSLFIPRFESAELRRVALAAWGYIPDEDIPHWRARFGVVELGGDSAFRALVAGQVGPIPASPLLLSMSHMNLIEQAMSHDWPYVYIFDNVTCRRLTMFWNLRARNLAVGPTAAVVGLPRQALAYPEQIEALKRWGASPEWQTRTPDFLVSSMRRTFEAVDQAFDAIGLD